ncbi:MAG: GIY-YIG nuclease family protein [Campylobacterales bacterium]|nr:GIY-YIG nuclease family protein [Campylobacterales bacterium]
MSQNGYVYLMSNVALKKGICKIGLTRQHPKDRARSLSTSTSIPTDFFVEYYKETIDFETAEKRIHLLLDDYRYAPNKEFFKINKKFAKVIIDEMVRNTELDYIPSNEFGKHNDLIMASYSKNMTLNALKILDLLMCSSQRNTPMHKLFSIADQYVSGFVSSTYVMTSFNVSKAQSMQILKDFAKNYSDLAYQLVHENKFTNIFDFIKYYRGELGWKFSVEYRELFYNYAKPNMFNSIV